MSYRYQVTLPSLGLRDGMPPTIQAQIPATANDVRNFFPDAVRADAAATRVVVHPRYPGLVQAFLQHKRQRGARCERELYPPGWTWQQQVGRLLAKRAVVFMGGQDRTLLRDGTTRLPRGAAEWDRVGTPAEDSNRRLVLADYLSYDEMLLGSLLGVSGPSFLVNDGARHNAGVPGAPGSFEPRAVVVGLVGARFERPDRMDHALMVRAAAAAGGGGRKRMHPELAAIFEAFLGGPYPGRDAKVFDDALYRARMRVTFDVLLLEAAGRAREAGRRARVYVVGFGLGVWRVRSEQTAWFLEAFAASLQELGAPQLGGAVGSLVFGYVTDEPRLQAPVRAAARPLGIEVVFGNVNPAPKLRRADELLVVSYPWDANAFPGNEYYEGMVSASGDPAAAAMSTISQLHNPLVNPDHLKRITVLPAVEPKT
ncbi:hypothetical protein F4780DRAFT_682815 [Xylariomycetidae sp. FL0641]|nr:hypothetical protein F4780DRAFT_682815 [Xylariomycetidae sp. FL0641]